MNRMATASDTPENPADRPGPAAGAPGPSLLGVSNPLALWLAVLFALLLLGFGCYAQLAHPEAFTGSAHAEESLRFLTWLAGDL